VDGQLFFAPASWKDESGKTVDDTSFWNALGPAARARSRLGAPPPAFVDTARPGGRRREPAEPPFDDDGDDGE
jgi:hypothetical protein